MEPRDNDFEILNNKLTNLYVKAEMLIKQNTEPKSQNYLLCEINDTYSLAKRAILSHENLFKG